MTPASITYPTPIRHVFIVILENAARSGVLSNGPFEKSLQSKYAYDSKYYAVCHPSAPNYLALTAGKTWQCGSDGYSTYATENIGDLAQTAGLSWNGFMESMPSACDTSNSYPYAVKHNPFPYYKNIVSNSTICKAHDVNFTAWTSDVSAGTVPTFAFFTPNLKNDGHDTGVGYADSWLKGWLSPLVNASFFSSSVFFITYDESGGSDHSGYNGTAGGNVYFVAVSPYAKKGVDIAVNNSHYSLLATTEWLLGLGGTGNNDSSSKFPPMKQLFNFSTSTSLSATVSATPTYGAPPLAVSFAGGVTGGLKPFSFAWKFGDGNTSTVQNPSHNYTSVGTYGAKFTVTDSLKANVSATVTITVSKTSTKLTAIASGAPTSGKAPITVNFKGGASGGAAPYSYLWKYAVSGTKTSTSRNTSHVYLYPGNYTATLTVTDAHNATAKAFVNVSVAKLRIGIIVGAVPTVPGAGRNAPVPDRIRPVTGTPALGEEIQASAGFLGTYPYTKVTADAGSCGPIAAKEPFGVLPIRIAPG